MTKNISNYLFSNLLKTFAISSLLTLIILQLINPRERLHGFDKYSRDVEMVALVIWTIVLAISSSSIFLNNYASIRKSPVWSFISFFLLPVILPFMFWILNKSKAGNDWIGFFISNAIFIVIHFYFYLKFSKKINQ
jgi:hypothetical protein